MPEKKPPAADDGDDGLGDRSSRPARRNPPDEKALALFERPIRWHTRPREICLEPFSGSGTQIIAAEKLGRRCRAIEISPAFVDVAVRRWEGATGRKAMLDGRDAEERSTRSLPNATNSTHRIRVRTRIAVAVAGRIATRRRRLQPEHDESHGREDPLERV